jgi:transcriptional regulator with XRE-family HTH domain
MYSKIVKDERRKLGKELRKLREQSKLSFYRIHQEINIHASQIRDIESGSTSYTIDSYIKLKYLYTKVIQQSAEKV